MGLKVFLDMDGVIVDFVGGLHKNLGLEYSPEKYPYPHGCYDIFDHMVERSGGRLTVGGIYDSCNTSEFWEHLEWDPLGQDIYETIKRVVGRENISICTSPMVRPDAWRGKVAWLKKHLPGLRDVIITSAPKHLLAKPGHILVDDKDKNVESFITEGGSAVLVPQPWNKAKDMYGDGRAFLDELTDQLEVHKFRAEFLANPCKAVWRAFT